MTTFAPIRVSPVCASVIFPRMMPCPRPCPRTSIKLMTKKERIIPWRLCKGLPRGHPVCKPNVKEFLNNGLSPPFAEWKKRKPGRCPAFQRVGMWSAYSQMLPNAVKNANKSEVATAPSPSKSAGQSLTPTLSKMQDSSSSLAMGL